MFQGGSLAECTPGRRLVGESTRHALHTGWADGWVNSYKRGRMLSYTTLLTVSYPIQSYPTTFSKYSCLQVK